MIPSRIAVIWLGGAMLALAIYAAGPDHFLDATLGLLHRIDMAIADMLAELSGQAFDAMRAAAIALFVVFLILGSMAARRGLQARGAMLLIGTLFLLLTAIGTPGAARWFTALLLAALGATTMTARLTWPHRR